MDLSTAYFRHLTENRKRSVLTLQAYDNDLVQFCTYLVRSFGEPYSADMDSLLLAVDSQIVEAYREYLAQSGLSDASISRKLTMLRGFYKWLVGTGRVENNPFSAAACRKSEFSSFDYLDFGGIQQLIETIPVETWLGFRDRAIVGLLVNTGMRVGELLDVHVDDLCLSEKRLTVHRAGKPARRWFLRDWVIDVLSQYGRRRPPAADDIPHLIVNRDGGPLTSRSIRRKLLAYGRRAGLKAPVTPASLRHSCAMLLLETGVRPAVVKKHLGHLSGSSLRPYLECLKQKQVNCSTGRCI